MALDRQSIEKRDFPLGRRGYEPAAVDAHLASIAREVEALQQRSRARAPAADAPRAAGESIASVASAQVQAIVEAAEASAAAIEREARENADQTAQDAARDAARTRDEAIERSQGHVGKVHEATTLMLQRVDAMESELSALLESLRTGANRVSADLSLLAGNMSELYAAADQSGGAQPAPPVEEVEAIAPEPTVAIDTAVEPEAEPATDADAAPARPRRAPADEDVEGARLIALNMALNGQSRAETDKYLAENFDLSDRDALLDEVYATIDG